MACIVDRKLLLAQLVIIRVEKPEALGDRREARALGSEIPGRRVRPAHDRGKMLKRGVAQIVLSDEGVETALLTVMAELNAGHIERHSPFLLRDHQDFVGRDKQKL